MLYFANAVASAQEPWADSYALEAAGDYEGARIALNAVIAADTGHELAIMRTAWLEYLAGDYNASIREYRRALEINAESLETQLGLTLPLLAQRRWREAARVAQDVLTVAPWNYYAHVRLMVAEEGQGQWQALARHAREVVRRYPSDATVLVYLARSEARQRNLDAALEAYEAVLERIPGHEEAARFIAQNGN
jgi:tetratricopeptide (TPR) repeat protein